MHENTGFAEPRHDAMREVACSFGRAAGQDDDVTSFERRAHRRFERRLVVREDAEYHRLAAGFGDGRGEDRAVAVIDAARTQRLPGLDELVAGRQHRDAWAAHHLDRGEAAGGQHADLARADRRALAQQSFAARDVGAGVGNELAARRRPAQIDRGGGGVFEKLGLFDHHHRIGAARDDAAGRDGGGCAGFDRNGRSDAAGDHFRVEGKPLRRAVAGARGIGGADGKTVDVGTVERRRIDRRDHVGGKDAAQAGIERQRLGAERREIDARLKAPVRFLGTDYFEELLLPRGAAHRVEDRRALLFRFQGHLGFKTIVVLRPWRHGDFRTRGKTFAVGRHDDKAVALRQGRERQIARGERLGHAA